MKKVYLFLLAVLALIVSTGSLHAQQTVGATTKPHVYSVLEVVSQYQTGTFGGLRLPMLSSSQRDGLGLPALTGNVKDSAQGLIIFNTDTKCVEYWNNTKWISLCSGSADISIKDDKGNVVDPTKNPFPADKDSTEGPFTPHDNPECTSANPPYTVALVTGTDYTTINILDVSTGTFTITMVANPTTSTRSAIVRITDNCTGQYKDELFIQKAGVPSGCDPSLMPVPDIKGGNTSTLCGSGATYLYLDPANSTTSTGTYIWTLNGVQIGTGTSYTATGGGNYIVYRNAIGCPNPKSQQVTISATTAPSPVSGIWATNDGLKCTSGSLITITAKNNVVSPEKIVWYLNGVKQASLIGQQITTSLTGSWTAVVENATCSSTPSNSIIVSNYSGSNSEAQKPDINYNGAFCKGGVVTLSVAAPVAGLTYTWYADGNQIGTGNSIYYPVSADASGNVNLSVRAASGSVCSAENVVNKTILSSTAPAAPAISGHGVICGSGTTLSGPLGTYTYTWYKGDMSPASKLSESSNQLLITQGGTTYYLTLTDGQSCVSPSGSKAISATPSDVPTLTWSNTFTQMNFNDTKVFSVSINYGPASNYTWNITPSSALISGQGTSAATIKAPGTAGPLNVSVTATNECGTSAPLSQSVNVTSGCTDASNVTLSPANSSMAAGTTINITASAQGQAPFTYKWYDNSTNSTSGGTLISGATSSVLNYTTSATGNHYIYCTVQSQCGGNVATSTTTCSVTVVANPTVLPTGNGTFTGRTCFDVNQSNDNTNGCGTKASRTSQMADFTVNTLQDPATATVTAPYSNNEVYTFTPSAAVTNVSFVAIDPNGIVTSVTPNANYSSVASGTACKVTVVYDNKLNSRATGLTTANALKADIYVVYSIGSNNYALKLSVSVKDCACCGAMTAGGGWLTMACHNLGADETLDPYSRTFGNNGNYYQWGIKAPSIPAPSSATDVTYYGAFSRDYYTAQPTMSWNAGTEAAPKKGTQDPCPTGWRLPTKTEWASITSGSAQANWSRIGNANAAGTNYDYGYQVTNNGNLYMPTAGIAPREGMSLSSNAGHGTQGWYWTSTHDDDGATDYYYFAQVFSMGTTPAYGKIVSYNGDASMSVRCVSE